MPKIPRFVELGFEVIPSVTPTFFGEIGFRKTACFPGISKMDVLGDAENPKFCRLVFKMNPRVTPTFFW